MERLDGSRKAGKRQIRGGSTEGHEEGRKVTDGEGRK